jgi:hypothetical protein
MYEQIFGKVGVFLNRDFLAKGLLPALVLLLLGLSAALGPNAIIAGASDVVTTPLQCMRPLIQALCVVLMTSALFIVFSSVIFSLFAGSALPRVVREWLRKRCNARRLRVQEDVAERESWATLIGWIRKKDLDHRPFIPRPEKQLAPQIQARNSDRALCLLRELDKRNSQSPRFRSDLDSWQQLILMAGLGAIRHELCQLEHDKPTPEAVKEWAKLLRSEPNAAMSQVLANAIKHEWVRARSALTREFPDPRGVQPTRLGNVLAALDEYGRSRYGIPTSVIWSRIWWLLTESERGSVSASKLGVDAGVNLTAALLLSALATIVVMIGRWVPGIRSISGATAPHWLTLVVIAIATAGTSAVSYRMSVSLVATLADKVSALADLRRLQCLRQMGFAPKSLKAEQALLGELWVFLGQGTPLGEASSSNYAGVAEPEDTSGSDAKTPDAATEANPRNPQDPGGE